MHDGDSTQAIDATQLVTTTDRLLALGRVTKRRGPHTLRPAAREASPIGADLAVSVDLSRARPRRRTAMLVAALALVTAAIIAALPTPAIASPSPSPQLDRASLR